MLALRIAAVLLGLVLTIALAHAIGGGGPAAMLHNGDKYRNDSADPAAPPRLGGAYRDGGDVVGRSRKRGRTMRHVR